MDSVRIGLYEKAIPNHVPMKEKLRLARKHGYDFLEMSIDETQDKLSRLDMTMDERARMVSDMFEEGLFIRSICLSGHRKYPLGSEDPKTRDLSLEIMRKAIILAYDLGVRIIMIAGYDEYYKESNEATRSNFLVNLRKSVEMAARYGVILAFETMETEFMNTIEKAMYYVNEINSPYLQVYPDLGNITNAAVMYGKSVTDDISLGKGNIVAFHLKETVPGVFREVPYGTGHVDFKNSLKTILDSGINLFVCEFWDTGKSDFEEDLKFAREFILENLKS
ncbi:L-ribulose-5-phosphate 3-epimerase [Youngiibacter multivorans]|uniref:L-ribulose-5-phosphate 3-epimerase n=1 Tax=Youngiibacter multivorans TaxID=937251 RepID=A0ABS4G6Q9_9CLOT|nr:L-ribulose-5-phosphate 3-epimerase [Youngiibacter multivorans]MBP1920214.1 L-ribulose-5-phosphate 3-epimerase [Youngiibacter multivorans]